MTKNGQTHNVSVCIQMGSDSIIGALCQIADKTSIKRSTIGNSTTVKEKVKVANSIIMHGVTIEEGWEHTNIRFTLASVHVRSGIMWNLRFKIQSYVARKDLKLYFLYNLTSYWWISKSFIFSLFFTPNSSGLSDISPILDLSIPFSTCVLFFFVFGVVRGQRKNTDLTVHLFVCSQPEIGSKQTQNCWTTNAPHTYMSWPSVGDIIGTLSLKWFLRRLLENVVGCVDLVAEEPEGLQKRIYA